MFLSYLLYLSPAVVFLFMTSVANWRFALYLSGLIAGLMLGLRDGVGWDYDNYVRLFQLEIIAREPISRALMQFTLWTEDYRSLFYIHAFLTLTILMLAVRQVGHGILFLNILLLPWFYLEAYTIIRQALAMAVCVAGYSMYVTDREKPKTLLLIVAPLIHYTSIPFVLCMFLLSRSFRFKTQITVVGSVLSGVVLGAVVDYLISSGILPILQFYLLDKAGVTGLPRIGLAACLLLTIFLSEKFNRKKSVFVYSTDVSEKAKVSKLIVLSGVLMSVAFSFLNPVYGRLGFYFFIPFIFVDWRQCFKVFGKLSSAVSYGVLFAVFLLMITIKSGDNRIGPMVPYDCHYFCS